MVERRTHRRHRGEVCTRWSQDSINLQDSDQSGNVLFLAGCPAEKLAALELALDCMVYGLPCFVKISPHHSQKQARDRTDHAELVLSSQYVEKGAGQAQDAQ